MKIRKVDDKPMVIHTKEKSDFRAVKVKECVAVPKSKKLLQFDYVVSNPPFKMDFSDTRERIAAMPVRFWAGVPKVPAKKKESTGIFCRGR